MVLHSQVNLHTTYGMGMVLYVGNVSDSPKSTNPLLCLNDNLKKSGNQKSTFELFIIFTITLGVIVLIENIVIPIAIVIYSRRRNSTSLKHLHIMNLLFFAIKII